MDLAQQVYQDLYDLHPETYQLLEQLFFHSAAAWDVSTMVTSSRKMFNATRDPKWARLAAWAEWVQVCPSVDFKSLADMTACNRKPLNLRLPTLFHVQHRLTL